MKRKYREAMRIKARRLAERDDDDEAIEARDWHDEWAVVPKQQDETNNNQGSQHE